MKKITWVGPDRLIPPYGSAFPGDVLELPDHVADSFVDQNLAAHDSANVSRKTLKSNVETED